LVKHFQIFLSCWKFVKKIVLARKMPIFLISDKII
jgi:hypothetical protein